MDLKVSDTFNKTAAVYYPGKYRQVVSMGGSRSSKTYSILQLLMLEMMSRKRIKITVWRNTKVTCRSIVLEDFKKIILFNPHIYKNFVENKQKGSFIYKPTKSEIIFEGADDIGKVLGSAQDISYFNEITEFSQDVYLQITQRTADKILCDYNPSKDFWLEKYRSDPDTVFIHSTFLNNAFCPKPIVKQLLSYEPWKPGSYEIVGSEVHYKGKKITREWQPPRHELNWKRGTANEYLWMVYGLGLKAEKPNKIYSNWNPISLEEFESKEYTSYFGVDFGSQNPTAFIEVKYDGDGAFYICPRFYKPLTDISLSLNTIIDKDIPAIKKGKTLLVCDSAKKEYIEILQMAGHLAVKAKKGNASVNPGISLVQSFTIYFVANDDLQSEYDLYSWETDRYGKATDKPIKADDHYMDALRYVITYLVKYLNIKV